MRVVAICAGMVCGSLRGCAHEALAKLRHILCACAQVLAALSGKSHDREHSSPDTFACFNPYFPDSKDRGDERTRLHTKLAADACCGIYVQMGSDLSLLEAGLQHLQAEMQAAGKPAVIFGSVFIPTKTCAAQCLRLAMHCVEPLKCRCVDPEVMPSCVCQSAL